RSLHVEHGHLFADDRRSEAFDRGVPAAVQDQGRLPSDQPRGVGPKSEILAEEAVLGGERAGFGLLPAVFHWRIAILSNPPSDFNSGARLSFERKTGIIFSRFLEAMKNHSRRPLSGRF